MLPKAVAQARTEIRTLLTDCHDAEQRRRLTAVDGVLAGKPEDIAAREAGVARCTVRKWILAVQDAGTSGLHGTARTRPLAANGAALRTLAANEGSYRGVKRLLAMACLAEGTSVAETAKRLRLPESTLRNWRKRFRAGGPAALRDSTPQRRDRSFLPSEWVMKAHDDIRIALESGCDDRQRGRLIAVNDILAGEASSVVAEGAGVTRRTVNYWVLRMRRGGVAKLMGPPQRASRR